MFPTTYNPGIPLDSAQNRQALKEILVAINAIPSSSAMVESAPEQIRTAVRAFEAARDHELTTRETLRAADGDDLERARQLDVQALADALRDGKPDPGSKHETEAEERLKDARRRHGAAVLQLQRAIDDVATAFQAHGPEWLLDVEESRDQLRAALQNQLDGVEQTWHQLRENAALRHLARHGRMPNAAAYLSYVTKLPPWKGGEEGVLDVAAMLHALRELAKPAEAPREAIPQQHRPPAQQVPGAGSVAAQSLGPRRDPEIVRAWQERDEAETPQAHARRAERMARAGARRSEREARRAAEDEAIEAVR